MHAAQDVSDEVATYFRALGYDVTWDFYAWDRGGLHWYEIYEGDRQLVQIDFGAKLADIKAEMLRFADGATDRSVGEWDIRGDTDHIASVGRRVAEHELAKGVQ